MGCARDAEAAVSCVAAARKSYCDTVRSVEHTSAEVPEVVSVRPRNGFEEAVCGDARSQQCPARAIGERRRTIVFVQTPFSTSHTRTVESNPQLYACSPLGSKTAFDTRAVWLFRTPKGALRFGRDASSSTRRRFLRSVGSSAGTSSSSGTEVSQTPMSPSQEAVRRCVPAALAATDASGAVCKWRDATVFDSAVSEFAEGVRVASRAVRSCEALATRISEDEGDEGTTQMEVTGAACTGMLCSSF